MSHWSEECLSSLDSKELKALCGHRNLQTEARRKKTRKDRMNLLINCKNEPNYNKLYKSELQLEMKARGLKVQPSHKVKQLKDILNNFTNFKNYELSEMIDESIEMTNDFHQCCKNSRKKLDNVNEKLKNVKNKNEIISILDNNSINYNNLIQFEKRATNCILNIQKSLSYCESMIDMEPSNFGLKKNDDREYKTNNNSNNNNENSNDNSNVVNVNTTRGKIQKINTGKSKSKIVRERVYIVWNRGCCSDETIDGLIAIFDNENEAKKCCKNNKDWVVSEFDVIDHV